MPELEEKALRFSSYLHHYWAENGDGSNPLVGSKKVVEPFTPLS